MESPQESVPGARMRSPISADAESDILLALSASGRDLDYFSAEEVCWAYDTGGHTISQ